MDTEKRLKLIKLSEKLNKNPDLSKKLGVEITNKNSEGVK